MPADKGPVIRRFGVEGFRRLTNIDIEMRPMMALIGANGVGKTSFMDALSLLSASARGSLNQHLSDLGGVTNVVSRNGSMGIALHTEINNPGYQPLDYNLKVVSQGQGYAISEETLTQPTLGYSTDFMHINSRFGDIVFSDPDSHKLQRPNWVHDPRESSLSQVPRMYQQSERSRQILSSATQYHVLDVSQRSPVKLPQQLRPAELPGENGEELASFLFNLRETNSGKFEAIEDSLKEAFPSFETLAFPIVAAGMISMTWKDKAFRNPFYMSELSEGTLRFLWLMSLLHSPSLSTITMIDEPEVSMHPELLAILAGIMREASSRTQIIVATHSDRLVRFLYPDEIMVVDIAEDGAASMSWANSLGINIGEWLKDYSLDEIWQMGIIGGRA